MKCVAWPKRTVGQGTGRQLPLIIHATACQPAVCSFWCLFSVLYKKELLVPLQEILVSLTKDTRVVGTTDFSEQRCWDMTGHWDFLIYFFFNNMGHRHRDILNEQMQNHSYKNIAWPQLGRPLETVSKNFSKLPWSAYTSLQHQPSTFDGQPPNMTIAAMCGIRTKIFTFFSSNAQIQEHVKHPRSRQEIFESTVISQL